MKLSEAMIKMMTMVVKMPEHQKMLIMNRTIRMAVDIDYPECEKMLEDLVINKDNVLRYLRRVYIPTVVENGLIFKDQKCIQRAVIIDNEVVIHIANSEIHKLCTDTMHVIQLLKENGFDVEGMPIRFRVDHLKVVWQDLPLYYEFLAERGIKITALTNYFKIFKKERPDLESIAKIKKRSVKRKYLRWHCKKGYILWADLRKIINISDFSNSNIKRVCDEIRQDSVERGVDARWK